MKVQINYYSTFKSFMGTTKCVKVQTAINRFYEEIRYYGDIKNNDVHAMLSEAAAEGTMEGRKGRFEWTMERVCDRWFISLTVNDEEPEEEDETNEEVNEEITEVLQQTILTEALYDAWEVYTRTMEDCLLWDDFERYDQTKRLAEAAFCALITQERVLQEMHSKGLYAPEVPINYRSYEYYKKAEEFEEEYPDVEFDEENVPDWLKGC